MGHPRRLRSLVEALCPVMAKVFAAKRQSLPPWRTAAAMLSKWRLSDAPAASFASSLLGLLQQPTLRVWTQCWLHARVTLSCLPLRLYLCLNIKCAHVTPAAAQHSCAAHSCPVCRMLCTRAAQPQQHGRRQHALMALCALKQRRCLLPTGLGTSQHPGHKLRSTSNNRVGSA